MQGESAAVARGRGAGDSQRMTDPVDDQIAAAVRLAQARLPDLRTVILYGSRAGGRPRPDSDIDLAVLCDRPVDAIALFHLAGDMSGLGPAPVDLADLRAPYLSALLRRDILLKGRVLIAGAEDLVAAEQVEAMGAFQEHWEATAQIREMFRERLRREARG